MSRRKARHLAPVPDAAKPVSRPWFETVELPTGGRPNVGGLLHELAIHAFHGALAGWEFKLDSRLGFRFHVTVRLSDDFPPERLEQGRRQVVQALLALGVVKPAKPADAAPPTEAETPEDGAQSLTPPPSSQT